MEIRLDDGSLALVDDERGSELAGFRWHAQHSKHTTYARRSVRTGQATAIIYMHHLVLPRQPELIVDHIDGNGLNNRRSNLRLVTHAQNLWNATHDHRSGVTFHKQSGKWRARMKHLQQDIGLGGFDDRETAILARRYAIAVLRGIGPVPDFDILRLWPNARRFLIEQLGKPPHG